MALDQRSFPQKVHRKTFQKSERHSEFSSSYTAEYGYDESTNHSESFENTNTPYYRQRDRNRLTQEMQQIVSMINTVKPRDYDEDTQPIFSSPEDVLLHIKEFMLNNICTKQQLFDEIGITEEEYQSFYRNGSNRVHVRCYHWFEKLRIAYGMGKTERRLKNEQTFPNGYPMKSKHGYNMKELFTVYGDRCHFCGEEGHWKDDCVKQKKKADSMRNDQDRSGWNNQNETKANGPKDFKKEILYQQFGNDCYKCGGIGHWAADCTE